MIVKKIAHVDFLPKCTRNDGGLLCSIIARSRGRVEKISQPAGASPRAGYIFEARGGPRSRARDEVLAEAKRGKYRGRARRPRTDRSKGYYARSNPTINSEGILQPKTKGAMVDVLFYFYFVVIAVFYFVETRRICTTFCIFLSNGFGPLRHVVTRLKIN